jgi:hypothetical protein
MVHGRSPGRLICGGWRRRFCRPAESRRAGNTGSACSFRRSRGTAAGQRTVSAGTPIDAGPFRLPCGHGSRGLAGSSGLFGVDPPPHNTGQHNEQNDQEDSFHGNPFSRFGKLLCPTLRRVHIAVQHLDLPGQPFPYGSEVRFGHVDPRL